VLILLISIVWFAFLSYFLLVFTRLYIGRENLSPSKAGNRSDIPLLSVIVPARNEEDNIERCISSLLCQSYPSERYQIIVVDDNSLDNTASIVSRLSKKHSNLTLMTAGNLPHGWGGKSNACRKGAETAEGEWFCFIDADVCAKPELLETAVNFAASKNIDLLTINPFQEILSLSERLFLPGSECIW